MLNTNPKILCSECLQVETKRRCFHCELPVCSMCAYDFKHDCQEKEVVTTSAEVTNDISV